MSSKGKLTKALGKTHSVYSFGSSEGWIKLTITDNIPEGLAEAMHDTVQRISREYARDNGLTLNGMYWHDNPSN
jgi:hypothetical protein